ncbi:Chitin synthase, class 2 [Perkinsus olseni]|uniref:Chitin synthase, class 2 n=1 Tax=Perkinsus olseni TaxID=32597 RepID=A0A7J6MV21_PEROL|nr:Chitin synthase, class 2 [Perkinsus olseni]
MAAPEAEPQSRDRILSEAPSSVSPSPDGPSYGVHPAVHPTLPDYRSYIDIDFDGGPPENPLVFLRYTPVTIRSEELVRHYNVDYRELGVSFPRPIANMFDTDFYRRFFHGKVEDGSFRLRFVSSPEQKVKIMITITIASYIQGSNITGFTSTLFSLMECIKDCCDRGNFVWNDFVVCAVIDGRREFSIGAPEGPRSLLSDLQHMGLYYNVDALWKDGAAMDRCKRLFVEDREARALGSLTVDHGQAVYMHIFETVVQLGGNSFPPLQIMTCVKEFAGISSASPTISRRPECHLWALEGIARHFVTVSDSEELQIVFLDCGICPIPSALLRFSDVLGLDDVAIVSGDTISDSDHQIPIAPAPHLMTLNPALAGFLMQRRIDDLLDGNSESALGGNSTRVNVAMCALRLDRVQTDQYFVSLTKTGNRGVYGPFRCNAYVFDDRVLSLAAAPGYRVDMLTGVRTQGSRLSEKFVSGSAEEFAFSDLIEMTRRSSTTFFMSLINLHTGLRRFSWSWRGVLSFPLIIIPRLATCIMSIFCVTILTSIIVAPLSISVPWARIPLAILLTALFTILVQLSIGCRGLSKGIQYAYMFVSVIVGFLWVLSIAFFMVRVVLYEPRVNLVAWCIVVAPYVITPLLSASLDDIFIFFLCWFHWFCLLPTTLVLGSGLYAICQSDILPWGTPGAYPNDPATTETQARRMEVRSWMVVFGTILNITPIVAYSYWIAHPSNNQSPPGEDAASQLALAAIDVIAWGISLPRLIGSTISVFRRLYAYWWGEGKVMRKRPKPISQDPCRIYVRDVVDGFHRVPVVTISSRVGTAGSNTVPSLRSNPAEWVSMGSQTSLFLPVPSRASSLSSSLFKRSQCTQSPRDQQEALSCSSDSSSPSGSGIDGCLSGSHLSSTVSDSDAESMDFIPGPTEDFIPIPRGRESDRSSSAASS